MNADLAQFLINNGFNSRCGERISRIQLPEEAARDDDWISRWVWTHYWSDRADVHAIQDFCERLSHDYDLKVTSYFRPSLTHTMGAIDIAPNLSTEAYAHNRKVDPRLYARPKFLETLQGRINESGIDRGLYQILVEDNHLHIQPETVRIAKTSLPKVSIMAQLNQRDGYERSDHDVVQDAALFNDKPWVPVNADYIAKLGDFIPRFS